MSSQRIAKVSSALRKIISELIQDGIKDPRIGFVTVTKVKVSKDLRHAQVFVNVLGNEQKRKATLKGLNNASGFIRSHLKDKIRLRYCPEIFFSYDDSLDYALHIENLLKNIKDVNKEK